MMMAVMHQQKILPHEHFGKLRHRHHTAYGALILLLLATALPLAMMTRAVVYAQDTGTLPSTDRYTTYAVVPGSAPAEAPTITSVAPGTIYTSGDPISVAGNCPTDTLVKVFKNNVFSGAAFCQNGHYAVQVSLFLGTNSLMARAYNTNNEQSPDSTVVPVTYQAPGAPAPAANSPLFSNGFFATGDVRYQGVAVGSATSFSVTLAGGQAPYAVSVAWGDGKTDVISRGTAGTFTIQHTYAKSGAGYKGSYNVTVQASDQFGAKTFMQLVAIVGGKSSTAAAVQKHYQQFSVSMKAAWWLIIVAVIIIITFWLGERWEKRVLKHRHMLVGSNS